MVDQYIFSGSLPEEATTYVTREADGELYEGLKAGKFCYVLNSRQSGKSSLRVRTMRRLRESGVECAAIDLSAGGIQNVPPEQWYADLIDTLIESFGLDVEFGDWWLQNQLNSLVTRFRKFLEEILLAEVKENIVIFIDEIDSVLSLNFPTDDFFAFIRACYNQRVDNPEYNRLTFCLLGVASPSNLIEDKKRTPFNIGKAISLKGFQLHEIEPLEKGLHGRYSDSQAVMKEILHWTGGQPFLTQKLCQFMVEESKTDNPRTVEQVVRTRIIENWESQDEPEHLRTIRDRILRDEQRAPYLLELFQKIRLADEQSEITADDTLEQSELQLSGLLFKQQSKLRVYNPIYKEVFDCYWIETQLRNLRPYSENFKFWLASECKDKSRLLRGKALQDALEWAKDKSLSYQDRQFLAASQAQETEEQIATKEQEAQLVRERKDREAAEKRNQVLTEANQKAQRRIHIGTFVLILTLSFTGILGILASDFKNQVDDSQEFIKTARKIANLDTKLKEKGYCNEEKERLGQANESVKRLDKNLNKALLNLGVAVAYFQLEKKQGLTKSQNYLKTALKYLDIHKITPEKVDTSKDNMQIRSLILKTQGDLLKEAGANNDAKKFYKEAFNIINEQQISPFNKNLKGNIISKGSVETVYKELIDLLSNPNEEKLKNEVRKSLKKYYLDELDNLLANEKWLEADKKTANFILYITMREKERYIDKESINNISCPDLRVLDSLWLKYSNGHFGFSVQKRIYEETGNNLRSYNEETYLRFARNVGWLGEKERWLDYEALTYNKDKAPRGHLPTRAYQSPGISRISDIIYTFPTNRTEIFFRAATCEL
ncbi:WD-40 repeat protein [Scytonema sp. HK-05]|uniref:GUN4 domain-containing protein n=1 Tax=Scytonema sp. HK-05 TaxID=1137095 RepID=UPI000936AFB5|nr:GUN4 domain-containing protein [Scytonema sp. HK-05]OKH58579.1 hypothetical protein NIES2130_13995 [Scytonema sp. HK-05]BAY46928.1 WD-40 repeat protein [Scytonema sp. HK-05]